MAKTTYKSVGLKPATAKFYSELANELNKRANGIVDIKLTTGLDVLAKKTTVAKLADLISNTSTPKKERKAYTKHSKRISSKVLNDLYDQLISNKSVTINVGTKQQSRKVATSLYNRAYVTKVKVSVKHAGKGKGFIVKTA